MVGLSDVVGRVDAGVVFREQRVTGLSAAVAADLVAEVGPAVAVAA